MYLLDVRVCFCRLFAGNFEPLFSFGKSEMTTFVTRKRNESDSYQNNILSRIQIRTMTMYYTHIARIGFERRHFPDYYRMYSTHAIPFANIEVHQKFLYVCLCSNELIFKSTKPHIVCNSRGRGVSGIKRAKRTGIESNIIRLTAKFIICYNIFVEKTG